MPDTFSKLHPLTNFVYFAVVIAFGVVIQSPFYLALSILGAGCYYLLLVGRKALGKLAVLIPVFLIVMGVNPIFNTRGNTVLFTCFGRAFTLEALIYGAILGGMMISMLLWFGCYSEVLTSDKFVSLFGGLIPSLSLLLVMILRLIPSFLRKARQIGTARMCIGKGVSEQDTLRRKLDSGMKTISALTDWALEGSITTADSMRSRGYGTGRRTHYQPYRLALRDGLLLCCIMLLCALVLALGGTGTEIGNVVSVERPGWGLAAYGALMLLPSILRGKEALVWRVSRSRI